MHRCHRSLCPLVEIRLICLVSSLATRLERGELLPRTVGAIRAVFEAAGVIFLGDGQSIDGGPGVRLRKSSRDNKIPSGPFCGAHIHRKAVVREGRVVHSGASGKSRRWVTPATAPTRQTPSKRSRLIVVPYG